MRYDRYQLDMVFDDDVIVWVVKAINRDGSSVEVDAGHSAVVADCMFDARKEIESMVPEWFV